MEERLQKYLAESGIASRRKCEELIRSGCIAVNGQVIKDMGTKVNSDTDIVTFNGQRVKKSTEKIYLMINKPVGYITTTREQFGRKKVTDLIKDINYRVYPIGRLDYNSSGLLLLTNDGDMAFKLTHPGHEVDKTYIVKVQGLPNHNELEALRSGVEIDGRLTYPAKVDILSTNKSFSVLSFIIHEGRNRQIRKMCSAVGHEVIDLKRTSIGKITLGDLKEGQYRLLTSTEIDYLNKL